MCVSLQIQREKEIKGEGERERKKRETEAYFYYKLYTGFILSNLISYQGILDMDHFHDSHNLSPLN